MWYKKSINLKAIIMPNKTTTSNNQGRYTQKKILPTYFYIGEFAPNIFKLTGIVPELGRKWVGIWKIFVLKSTLADLNDGPIDMYCLCLVKIGTQ